MKKGFQSFCLLLAVMLMAHPVAAGMRYDGGHVWLTDGTGAHVVGVGPLKFNGMGNARANVTNCVTRADGSLALALSVDRHPEANLTATVCETNGRYSLDYRLAAPESFRTWGVQGTLRPAKGMGKGRIEKRGFWNRCKQNPEKGEPFETYAAKMKRIGSKTAAVWYVVGGDENWGGNFSEHFAFSGFSNDVATAHVTLYAARPDEKGFEIAARHKGRPLAIELTSPMRNNIFESGSPELTLELANVTDAEMKGVKFAVDVWDWDGVKVLHKESNRDIPARTRKGGTLKVPVAGRGLWFCEARATGPDGKEVFARTNVAILPPHEFAHRDESIFGMIDGCGRIGFDMDAEMKLMARMGVHWLRSCNSWALMEKYGIEPIAQIDFSIKGGRPYDPEVDAERVRNCVKSLIDHKIRYAEMGNEIGHRGTAEERRRLFTDYMTWLDAYRAERERQGGAFKIVYGTSSFRPDLMRIMNEHEVWTKLDEYVIHPARGYWTADKDAGGWRYLGLIRGTRRILTDEFGIKDPKFHLTEVYSKTLPNNSWADSYRQAGENMLLTAALAVSEPGVRSFTVHKLHEGISWDANGIKVGDMEYHYGLLHRDNSPKPSFMGYVTAAEELDGAKFRQWVYRNEKKDKLRGLIYDTPRGPLALLWDRTEGEMLCNHAPEPRKKGEGFYHFEPWRDHWRVKNRLTFNAAGKTVTVIDVLGRRKELPVSGKRVTLTLDGGPIFVYGLTLTEFTHDKKHETVHKESDVEEIDKQNRE